MQDWPVLTRAPSRHRNSASLSSWVQGLLAISWQSWERSEPLDQTQRVELRFRAGADPSQGWSRERKSPVRPGLGKGQPIKHRRSRSLQEKMTPNGALRNVRGTCGFDLNNSRDI